MALTQYYFLYYFCLFPMGVSWIVNQSKSKRRTPSRFIVPDLGTIVGMTNLTSHHQPDLSPKPIDSETPLLSVRGLSQHFSSTTGWFKKSTRTVQAVNEINLDVMQGEILGLVGESGCGKSTLGRTILQLLRPTAGEVWFDGQEISKFSHRQLQPVRREMQMVFQNPYASLNPRMTIDDTLTEPFAIHRLYTGPERRKEVLRLLDRVGLPPSALYRYPHEFSGGQRQRVGIARAIALKPKLVIADEPVSALDVSVQAQILNLLKDLQQEMGLTLIFIAHNLSVVRHISDRVAVMYLGELAELAPVEQLFASPRHPYTQALLSAVPVPNPALKGRKRVLLQGDLPDPANPPSGCRFRTRCLYADDLCTSTKPPLEISATRHGVACHHWASI
jgi:oligopeptide/dipeptide ABC transporter ATP-binding protein